MVFAPQLIDGMVMMDGGTVHDVNLISAIHQCLDGVVDDVSKIILDVTICQKDKVHGETPTKNAYENF